MAFQRTLEYDVKKNEKTDLMTKLLCSILYYNSMHRCNRISNRIILKVFHITDKMSCRHRPPLVMHNQSPAIILKSLDSTVLPHPTRDKVYRTLQRVFKKYHGKKAT
ncbi:unnamed protein product [Rhizopus stolonifer]